MFVGATTTFHRPLLVGETVNQEATVKSVARKEGHSGPLVFVSVEYRFGGEGGPAVTEIQTLIYTDAAPAPPREPPAGPGPPSRPWRQDVPTDPVLLFRFSALTNNFHRIHYDHPYATGVEGYSGLVVQGPLTALLLADLARRNGVTSPARFSFRARSPFLCGNTLCLRGGPDPQAPGRWTMETYSPQGRLGLQAEFSS